MSLQEGQFNGTAKKFYRSSSLEGSKVITTAPCFVHRVEMANTNAATRYLQIFNNGSVPANGTAPSWPAPASAATFFASPIIKPGTSISPFDTGHSGVYFASGLSICNSTTQNTKTLGSADSFFYVWYSEIDT